jgi:hypothetical protein
VTASRCLAAQVVLDQQEQMSLVELLLVPVFSKQSLVELGQEQRLMAEVVIPGLPKQICL